VQLVMALAGSVVAGLELAAWLVLFEVVVVCWVEGL